MRILFVSHVMPGVFGPLAGYFAAQSENEVVFAAEYIRRSPGLAGVRHLPVRKTRIRRPAAASGSRREDAARELQRALLRSDAMHESLHALREDGFDPDIIVTSSGMGVSMLTREAFPQNFLAAYLDWFSAPAVHSSNETSYRRAVQRLMQAKLVVDADYLFTLSQEQRQQFPAFLAERIDILPPCVDTDFFCPDAALPLVHEERCYGDEDEILVFSVRSTDMLRDEPLWAALHMLLMQRPRAHVFLLCGNRGVRETLPPGRDALPEGSLARIHLLDFMDDACYRDILCAASVFALLEPPSLCFSSVLEAMSCGAALVLPAGSALGVSLASDGCASLCEGSSLESVVAAVLELLEQPARLRAMQQTGRKRAAERYCRQRYLPMQADVLLHAWRRWRESKR